MSPMYPLTPNICVEGGKIEFIKSPPGSARNSLALASPPQSPLLARRGSREKREARIYDEPTEKFDGDKTNAADQLFNYANRFPIMRLRQFADFNVLHRQ
ncbi:hypothetical protein B5X24_HaOG212484 [Helicoverpa armigera]|nr:hypothetical protein B5X24_HaOG212484 [Helicoverpa armigera]